MPGGGTQVDVGCRLSTDEGVLAGHRQAVTQRHHGVRGRPAGGRRRQGDVDHVHRPEHDRGPDRGNPRRGTGDGRSRRGLTSVHEHGRRGGLPAREVGDQDVLGLDGPNRSPETVLLVYTPLIGEQAGTAHPESQGEAYPDRSRAAHQSPAQPPKPSALLRVAPARTRHERPQGTAARCCHEGGQEQ